MPIYDSGFKIIARTSGRELAEVAGLSCSHWRPIVSEVQVTERFADRAFRATYNGERCVVYFEAYVQWRKNALWNVLAKAGMLSEREQLPTLTVLYLLRPRGAEKLDGKFRLQVGGQPTQQLWYFPVPLWKQKPADWWEASPGLMALYPLTQHEQRAPDAVRYAAEAIRITVAEPDLRADLLASLAFFGKMAYPSLDLLGLLGREQMKKSRFWSDLVAEDRQDQIRTDILAVLDERVGKEAAASVSPLLAELTDEKRLSLLLRVAARCGDLEEFQQQLAPE